MPPNTWYDYGGYVEIDNTHTKFPPKRKDIGNVAIVARGHYQDRIINNTNDHGTIDKNTDEMDRWVDSIIDTPRGKYFIYRNNRPDSYSVILIDIIGTGDKLPNTKDKTLNDSMTNEEGEPIKKMIIFTNYYRSMRKKPERRLIPCNGQTELKALHKPKPKKDGPDNPFAKKPNFKSSPNPHNRKRKGNKNRGRRR